MTMIAHITAPAQFGGLERVVAGLCREMVARGHEVVLVATLSPGVPVPSWAEDVRGTGVIVEPLHLPTRAYLAERRAVRALLRRHGVEVVHTHGYRSDVIHAGTARGLGLPLVSTAHGFASTGGRGHLYEWFQKRAWRRFDAVIAVSKPLIETLAGVGVRRDRLSLIRNGLATRTAPLLARAEARASLGLPPTGPLVGWVGRMSEEKWPGLAIEAVARTPAGSATLCLIGAGPLLEQCRARAAELGVADRVILPGAVPDAAPLLGAFDALVLSSRTEGTPMVVLEAAAAGIPVISTAVGGVPDLLGDEAGWLVAPGDAGALSEAILSALGDPRERERRAGRLRERLATGSNGKDWVEQHLELYRRLLSG